MPAVLELLDPQVEWRAPTSLPWGGTFHGHDGFQEFLGKVTEHLDEFRLEPLQLLDVRDRIVVLLRLAGRPTGRATQFNVPEVHVWTLRQGRIVGHEAYFDTAIVLRALGLDTSPDQMDRVLDEHVAAEESHDLDGLMATLTDDAEHDVVGFAQHRGRKDIRAFYEEVFKLLEQKDVQPLRRYYGENFVVDEVIYDGHADGALFGCDGHRGRVSFRMLHVLEFRDGLISRENVWMDIDAARRQLLDDDARVAT
jgi:ketosteroid isomerase-like protein